MERRSFPRIPVQLHTEIEISVEGLFGIGDRLCPGDTIRCMVTSIDISLGGFSVRILRSPLDTNMSFSAALAYQLVGREITAFFKEEEVTVTGRVVRIDPETMLMAVIITRVSDIGKWREVCGQAIMNYLDE
ncbi:MAG: PilZ domain protein [Deltaproteobacteria bacterium ADurb.BinA179]|jgi:hypothetical protein|nr:MAG: PilZ domain protein [Deltaproteobacteria bacterium ADurb.BinA179]HOD71854.1 PilZ domain-containing protein [Deltaproteobacteria bacterium]HRR22091.1 PilZ domain-containing protein [Desulfomonilia bacterium]HON62677.1 PilZ domain-containing protein [Deltaproteobacteria bacterium]HQM21476.1 PilZ domain-containing protein [Deltaproteobacteria bacterium]